MIEFTLVGNQSDKTSNPIPYHRTTQASFWDKDSKRYNAWKQFVRQEYWLQTTKKISDQKPFGKDFKGKVEFTIGFRNESHADPDNIAKGILDALFENDKHVDIATSHTCNNKVGKVIIKICIDCQIRPRKNTRKGRFLMCQVCIDYQHWEKTVKLFYT